MSKLRAIVAWLVLAPVMMCYAENIYFKTVDATDGLADNFVRDIVRDSHGFIWFSTINGLNRFDGLLEQGRTNISEVADRVGMSPKQFSLYFKQMFGDTPSDFLKKCK
ncbi:MAG: hypothetical protein IKH26_09425 [Bacteroidaceae bacterium]|nr:hypothetical protein [Bacteroidaceae bacterium]